MTAVISLSRIRKRFGRRTALDGVDLEVREGEVYGLLGPNGAGKTTLISVLLGLTQPTSGRRWLFGHDLDEQPGEALRRVGSLIEGPAFYPFLSGRDNLRCLGGVRRQVRSEQVVSALDLVGLGERGRDPYRSYSLGMKQRLGIALALLHDPDLLVLDEPTNALDPRGVVEVRELIKRLAGTGKTVLLCTHVLSEAQQVCDRVGILSGGRLVREADVSDLVRTASLESVFLTAVEELPCSA